MIGIILVAHQPLGSALAAVVQHVLGTVQQLSVVDVIADTPIEKIRQQLEETVAQVDTGEGVLILTDLYGATPANVASPLTSAHVKVVTGVSLPMLLRAVTYRAESLERVAEKAATGGVQGVVQIATGVAQKQAVVTQSDDWQQRSSDHHQQQQQQ
jgi:PTS system ascorbate-specific IIA component